MIDALFEFFRTLVDDPAEEETSDTTITLAAVALMLEVARADDGSADVEVDAIESILRARFQVESVSISQLIEAATHQVETATDLYQFTQLINEHYSYSDKERLIQAMWLVAYSDGRIADIEDHIIRRIAGLVHLAHEDFIRLKLSARDSTDD